MLKRREEIVDYVLKNTQNSLFTPLNISGVVIFMAFAFVVFGGYITDHAISTVTLILGVIAAILADYDEHIQRKIRTVIVTLLCFACTSLSVVVLFNHPYLFVIGLMTSTFLITMLGAIGEKYTSISFSSLLIAIYTMLTLESSSELIDVTTTWTIPVLLVLGAGGYFLLSLALSYCWPHRQSTAAISKAFLHLSELATVKSSMFQPSRSINLRKVRLEEANINAKLVTQLELCRQLLTNQHRQHLDPVADDLLSQYFIAQELHERLTSSHCDHQTLHSYLGQSDLLYRIQNAIDGFSQSCQMLATRTHHHKTPLSNHRIEILMQELEFSLDYHGYTNSEPEKNGSINGPKSHCETPLHMLFNNFKSISDLIERACKKEPGHQNDRDLYDALPNNMGAFWEQFKAQFNVNTRSFRHGIRLSLALAFAYTLVKFFELEQGYWVLMTILFVCQPNYSSTRMRIYTRLTGTVLGVMIATPLLSLLPTVQAQMLVIIISGTLFFHFKNERYGVATFFMTTFVIFLFHQQSPEQSIFLPRILDTILGCCIALALQLFVFPDWQHRTFHLKVIHCLDTYQRYLSSLEDQYTKGKRDTLAFRKARRAAHLACTDLASALLMMRQEPKRFQHVITEAEKRVYLCHQILNILSSLGAQRPTSSLQYESDLKEGFVQLDEVVMNCLEQLSDRVNFDNDQSNETSQSTSGKKSESLDVTLLNSERVIPEKSIESFAITQLVNIESLCQGLK
ncbi:YccS family putative transporter [Vibrio sp.]|nr:YccS family putative transporter [Vibrio sp.]